MTTIEKHLLDNLMIQPFSMDLINGLEEDELAYMCTCAYSHMPYPLVADHHTEWYRGICAYTTMLATARQDQLA